jgi:tRNA-specific 2-thiouridylase
MAEKKAKRKKQKVFVAMSGGVDSSVAALLLKQKGCDVTGVFMKNWTEGCGWKEDRRDAMRVCAKFGIPFLTFDFTREYRKKVINYMLEEYLAGKTPNPDVMCNKKIKFDLFLKKAKEMGANYIASGHYVRLRRKAKNQKSKFGNYALTIARDPNKDQSYFLWTLTQKQLKYCLFPIGDYLKSEVREIARKSGLPNAEKKDSQGLCFVGKVKFRDFLNSLLKKSNLRFSKNGPIKTTDGKIIGEHKGLMFYTIGQRHGIGVADGKPYFVARKEIENNILVVARKNDPAIHKKEIFVKDVNWIVHNPGLSDSRKNKKPFLKCEARIRYRQPLQSCGLYGMSKNRLKASFKKAVWAVAPGQSIVFYKNKKMLGGGVIE